MIVAFGGPDRSGSILPSEDRYDMVVQVLIIGGGACGLTAALAARDEGADVVVLEADSLCRGSSGMSLGALCAAGTTEQRIYGVEDDAAAFEADILAKTEGRADRLLARVVAERSGPTLDWLAASHGLGLSLDTSWRPAFGHSRMRMHVTPGRSGQDLVDRLVAACEHVGAMIVNDARVEALHADADGRVTGVRVRRPDGGIETIGCDALILATCGFGGNTDLVARHIPDMADARYFGWEGNRGDGILWGEALGGATADMDAYQGLGLLAEPQGIDVNPRFLIGGGFQVNSEGRRFSDELDDVSGQGARVIAQPGGIAWLIYDERLHRACEALPQYRALLDLRAPRVAADIEALAAAIEVSGEVLAVTFADVRRACGTGLPDAFGRRFDAGPLLAPYHAIKVTGALFHTQGGLVVDADARVRRLDGTALPNLFAGGGTARSISGPGPSGYLPGVGLTMAITLGSIAGTAAASMVAQGSLEE